MTQRPLPGKLLIFAISIAVGNIALRAEAQSNRTVQSIRNETSESADVSLEIPSAIPPSIPPSIPQRGIACPTDPVALTSMLLRDIPNYTNRVLQRTTAVLPWTEADEIREAAGEFVRQPYRPSHVITAGQADLTPLDLSPYTYTTDPEAGGPLTQLFFTTLSRHYSSALRSEEIQEYHWLFLAPTSDGWRLAFMFSEIDNPQTDPSPMPPRESSQSSVGQALQIWLRDCRARTLQPLQNPPVKPSSEAQIEQISP